MDRRYEVLQCPICGTSPLPQAKLCPGCGREILTPSGCIDLLDAQHAREADLFADRYRALRTLEGWSDRASGKRARLVERAARFLDGKLLVVDVGAGGGWAARYLRQSAVIALDLMPAASEDALCVRGDMRSMPIRSGTIDGLLFAASFHYAPVDQIVGEVARVLKLGGVLVVADSPIYATEQARAAAKARSAAYYNRMGFPDLVARYHPIAASELRHQLTAHRFRIDQFEASAAGRWWRRLARRAPGTLVVATRVQLP